VDVIGKYRGVGEVPAEIARQDAMMLMRGMMVMPGMVRVPGMMMHAMVLMHAMMMHAMMMHRDFRCGMRDMHAAIQLQLHHGYLPPERERLGAPDSILYAARAPIL
jgi:hypothetical protein